MKHNCLATGYIGKEMTGVERTINPPVPRSLMFPGRSSLTFLDIHKGPFKDVNVEFSISAKWGFFNELISIILE